MKKLMTTLVALIATTMFVFANTTDYETGKKAYENKDYATAITHLEKALKQDSKNIEIYSMLGESQIEVQPSQAKEAVDTFTQLIKVAPNNKEGYFGRASAYAALEKWSEAQTDIDQAYAIDPKDPELGVAKAMIGFEAGDKEKAMEDINKLIDENPKYGPAYSTRGIFKLAGYKISGIFDLMKGSKLTEKAEKEAEKEAK